MEKKQLENLLFVVDMINGFCKEGALADPGILEVVQRQKEIIEGYLEKENSDVIFIADSHDEGCKEFDSFPVHCLNGSEESEIIDELKVFASSKLIIKKNSTSAMFAPGVLDIINENRNLRRVEIVGCCTDICISNFAIPLACYFNQNNRHVDVVVDCDAVSTYDSLTHNKDEYSNMAFKLMEQSGVVLVKKLGKVENR